MDSGLRNESISLIFDLNNAILVRWNTAVEWVGERRFCKQKGADVYKEEVSRAVYELFLMVRNSLATDMKLEEYQGLENQVMSDNMEDVEKAFTYIDLWLYRKGVTKFDTKRAYQRHRVEEANRVKGL